MLASGTEFGRSKEGCDYDSHEQGWKLQMGICMGSERGKRGGSFQLKRLSNNSYIVIHTKTAIKNRKEREK
jgi:hypothetical protein